MKTHKNHFKNQAVRRSDPKVRRIVNGKPFTFWPDPEEKKPEEKSFTMDPANKDAVLSDATFLKEMEPWHEAAVESLNETSRTNQT